MLPDVPALPEEASEGMELTQLGQAMTRPAGTSATTAAESSIMNINRLISKDLSNPCTW
jgi:hypothetical protein